MKIEVTSSELVTIRIALTEWIHRCEREALLMEGFAVEFPDKADKCHANAKASRELGKEAKELLDRL